MSGVFACMRIAWESCVVLTVVQLQGANCDTDDGDSSAASSVAVAQCPGACLGARGELIS